ncbi:MAG: acetyl-CoA carboxylase biotin carboxyl carrier protein [Candidatus Rokubacteria bacterium]|nr:acetyl-CoA carboxylase biotin carboxyl carrier protein [Candidatus Rokubacteria bacterium]
MSPDAPSAADLVRSLGHVLAELGLTEVEIDTGTLRVRVQRAHPAATAMVHASAPVAPAGGAQPALTVVDAAPAGTVRVEAPMVGVFYRASSPTSEPYVREGDVVKEGQIVCIIEAMKLMNEIECRTAGRIVTVVAENGQPVEYGQPLFLIDPQR